MSRVYHVNDHPMQNYAKSRVFKIIHINKDDVIKKIYVFCGVACPDVDALTQHAESMTADDNMSAIEKTRLFSSDEISTLRRQSITMKMIIFVKERINLDDTIHTVKRKVLTAIRVSNPSPDSEPLSVLNLYLVGRKVKQMDTQTAYNLMSRDNRDQITAAVFENFISNIEYPNNELNVEKLKSFYSYDDIRALRLEEKENLFVNVALGHSFKPFKRQEVRNNESTPPYVFSVNPFIGASHVPQITDENFKNEDNVMLMDYGLFSDNANTLYLYTLEDVETFYEDDSRKKSVNNAKQTYFPFYVQTKKEMRIGDEPSQHVIGDMGAKDIEDRDFTTKCKNVNVFYDIYDQSDVSVSNPEGQASTFTYLKKGIYTVCAIFSPVKLSRHIPLETVFKFLCSSDKIPFIRLRHDGVNRDSVFKLHAPQMNRYGNRVPVLSKAKFNTINNDLCCKTLKSGVACVSLYLKGSESGTGDNDRGYNYVMVEFNSRCEIAITVQMRDATSCDVSKMDAIISSSVNPIISKMNILFGQNGFLLPQFESMYDTERVRIVDMKYDFKVTHKNRMNMDSIVTNCGNGIFRQMMNGKRSDDGITYEFSRVSNYTGAKNALHITFVDGINTMAPNSREIYTLIRVEKITNIHFLTTVPVYIDALLRIFHSEVDRDKCFNQRGQIQSTRVEPEEEQEPAEAEATSDSDEDEINHGFTLDPDFVDNDSDAANGGSRSRSRSRSRGRRVDGGAAGGATAANIKTIDKKGREKFFLTKLQTDDPTLFTATGKLTYAQGCVNRCKGDNRNKPIALTDDEMANYEKSSGILKNNKAPIHSFLRYSENDPTTGELIVHAIRFGSSVDKMKWYICPRFWDTAESNLQNTKPESYFALKKSKEGLPAHVHDFADAVNDQDYTPLFPGLIKKSFMPCCFGSSLFSLRASGDEEKNGIPKWKIEILKTGIIPPLDALRDIIEQERPTTSKPMAPVTNILKSESKLDATNLGYLPVQIQKFMNTGGICDDATLKTSGCILRHGVERSQLQSFLGAIAVIHSNPPPTIKDMRDIVANAVTLDLLVSYNNGSLITQFYDKGADKMSNDAIAEKLSNMSGDVRNSDIFKQLSISAKQDEEESNSRYDKFALLYKLCTAHIKFTTAIKSDQTVIDHELLWDVVTTPNSKLFKKGANMIIFDLPENDETHAVNILCPPNRHVDSFFDHRKFTFILIRRLSKEGYSFYEPICLYGQNENAKTYQFMFNMHTTNAHSMFDKIKRAIRTVSNMQSVHCPTIISRLHGIKGAEKGYKPNYHARHIERVLTNHGVKIISQILNYDNRVVGLFVTVTIGVKQQQREMNGFIPTESSTIIMDDHGANAKYEIKYTDDTQNKWLSLCETTAFLLYVNKLTRLPCKPLVDVTDDSIENPMIIGIITETNQFVRILPERRKVLPDGEYMDITTPVAMAHAIGVKDDHFMVDRALLLDREYDTPKRLGAVRGIEMETNFLNAFRMTARNLFQKKENANIYKNLNNVLYDGANDYKKKLKGVKNLLYTLMREHVIFEDYDISALSDISSCLDDASCNRNDGDGSSGDDSDDGKRQHNHPKRAFCVYNEGSGKNKCALRIPLNRLLMHKLGSASQKRLEPIFYSRLADELVRYERMREFIMGTKLSKHNMAIRVPRTLCEDEIILTQSMVGKDAAYFAKEENVLDYSDDNVKRAEIPNTSVFNLKRKKAIRKVVGITNSAIPAHVINVLPEKDSSKFTMDVFYGMPGADADGHITFALMVNILHVLNILPSDENVNSTKQILYDIYSNFDIASNKNKICDMWMHFGRPMQALATAVLNDQLDLETAINHTAYTLTPFDIWLLAQHFSIPIILLGDPKMNDASPKDAEFFADFFVNGAPGKPHNARILYAHDDAEAGDENMKNFHIIVCIKPLNNFPVYAIVQDLDPARQPVMRHSVDMGVNITLDMRYELQPKHSSADFLGIEEKQAEQMLPMPVVPVVSDDSGSDSGPDDIPEIPEGNEEPGPGPEPEPKKVLPPIPLARPVTNLKLKVPTPAAVAADAPQPKTAEKPEPPKSQIAIHMESGERALDKALNGLNKLTASAKTPMMHSDVSELRFENEERKDK